MLAVSKLYPEPQVLKLLEAIQCLAKTKPCYQPDIPDLYFSFNQSLEQSLGQEAVGFLRLGLSRNDLDMTVYKMAARDSLLDLMQNLLKLRQVLLEQAQTHLESLMVAYTHHQAAQPTSLGHYLLAAEGLFAKLGERMLMSYRQHNHCPLGAAALAGTGFALDRFYTANLLAFDAPCDNSYAAVADSDWQLEIAHHAESMALHGSRLVCDLLRWAEAGYFVIEKGLSQGSSIMPQKRNPVGLEHTRTRFSRILGHCRSLTLLSHNIPFGDLNDVGTDAQESLYQLFKDSHHALELLSQALKGGEFKLEAWQQELAGGEVAASELADEILRHFKLSFQKAHHLVTHLVNDAHQQGKSLIELNAQDLNRLTELKLSPEFIRQALNAKNFVNKRYHWGGPAPKALETQLKHQLERFGLHQNELGRLKSKVCEIHKGLNEAILALEAQFKSLSF
ncbi:MAG: lyase family protein [Deinococcales bacterium]